jgi:hypothetical protein
MIGTYIYHSDMPPRLRGIRSAFTVATFEWEIVKKRDACRNRYIIQMKSNRGRVQSTDTTCTGPKGMETSCMEGDIGRQS